MINFTWCQNSARCSTRRHSALIWRVTLCWLRISTWGIKQDERRKSSKSFPWLLKPRLSVWCGMWSLFCRISCQGRNWSTSSSTKLTRPNMWLMRHRTGRPLIFVNEWVYVFLSVTWKSPSVVIRMWGKGSYNFFIFCVCFLTNVQVLPCSTDILYLYPSILVYEQCFVVTVVIV